MSAILSSDDLNDFISPGAVCIKPVEEVKNQGEATGEVEIQLDSEGKPLEISKIDGKTSALSPAQISLADCLACSGCITSAEEVLVAQHSHNELLKALREKNKTFVVSISHQSRASLANAYGYTVDQMDRLLVHFFQKELGFRYVVGTALGRKLSLLEESRSMMTKRSSGSIGPVLSSVCPGWVLYAEKTHPHILSHMSTVKSTQQITGCLLKTLTARNLQINYQDIYHLSIMPCFDKKLESARPEEDTSSPTPDVDCVLTAKELINLVESSEFSLVPKNLEEILQDQTPIADVYASCAPANWPAQELTWANDSGSESGGYAYNYLSILKAHLIQEKPEQYDEQSLQITTLEGKNSDIYEIRLMHRDEKLASAAVVNGFKNIQNLVRKLKPAAAGMEKKTTKANPLAARRRARLGAKAASDTILEQTADASKCDYVEIMACPNGCINGGGQILRPPEIQEKEWLAQVKDLYKNIRTESLASANSALARNLDEWSEKFRYENGISRLRLYHTIFKEVEKPTDPNAILLGAKW